MSYATEMVPTPIKKSTKEDLLKLIQEFPDIKQTYFVSDAIDRAIKDERMKRGLRDERNSANS